MGVVLASILCGITLLFGIVVGLAWLLETRLGFAPNTTWIAWAAIFVMMPYAIAVGVDRRMGARLAPDGPGTRVIRAVLGAYARIGMGMANNPALALLSSHRGRKRTILLIAAIFLAATFAASTSYYMARSPDDFGSYDAFPDSDEVPTRAIDSAHYDDRRDPLRSPITPFVQSTVIVGPYLQLVIPWVPDRDGPSLSAQCGTQESEAQLACYALHVRTITLDGKPIAPVFDIGEDARTNRPALIALIDVRSLARGRHLLGVTLPPRHRDGHADDAPNTDFIQFWR
jgi:hypothetical protein